MTTTKPVAEAVPTRNGVTPDDSPEGFEPTTASRQFEAEVAEGKTPATTEAELIVKGRGVEIPEHYRVYVAQQLARLERFDPSIYRFDVELAHEPNPRQSKAAERVELTVHARGPVARGEACADSFYGAFEAAMDKLEGRLRRAKSRRHVHYGDKTPLSVAEATAVPLDQLVAEPAASSPEEDADPYAPEEHLPGQVVRTKTHQAKPMTTDEALYEMELVGHDFFLFQDKESGRPSVVYRRHAFDYGLIRLE